MNIKPRKTNYKSFIDLYKTLLSMDVDSGIIDEKEAEARLTHATICINSKKHQGIDLHEKIKTREGIMNIFKIPSGIDSKLKMQGEINWRELY